MCHCRSKSRILRLARFPHCICSRVCCVRVSRRLNTHSLTDWQFQVRPLGLGPRPRTNAKPGVKSPATNNHNNRARSIASRNPTSKVVVITASISSMARSHKASPATKEFTRVNAFSSCGHAYRLRIGSPRLVQRKRPVTQPFESDQMVVNQIASINLLIKVFSVQLVMSTPTRPSQGQVWSNRALA